VSASSRQTSREALAALLSAGLTGTGKPVQAVYAYKIGDFKGQSPVTCVTSGGSARKRDGMESVFYNRFRLIIQNYVLYADPSAGWTEQNAEDRLDLIEKSIAEVLLANPSTANWIWLEYDGQSQVLEAVIGGEMYLLEIIPVIVEVSD
jgi:hypothetical protein